MAKFLTSLTSPISYSFYSSYAAEKETCALLQRGVAVIFGPQSDASADHIRSITDSVEIPFIDTRWNYHPSNRVLGSETGEEYTVNLHPDVESLSKNINMVTG